MGIYPIACLCSLFFAAGTLYGISSTSDKSYQFGYDEGYKNGAKVALIKHSERTDKK